MSDPRSPPRLATYGTLAPGRPNHHHLADPGRWFTGHVHGRVEQQSWGAALGFPALVPDPDGDPVQVHVLESVELPEHWQRLDDLEGPGYRSSVVVVQTDEGETSAWLYILR